MLRIKELHIENVGPFEKQTVRFPEKTLQDKAEIHLLIGENGSGKTSILHMLAAVLQDNSIIKRFRFPDKRSFYRITFSDESKAEVYPLRGTVQYSLPTFIREYLSQIQNNNFSYAQFATAFFAYSGYRKLETLPLQSIQEVTENPFKHASDFNQSANSQALINWIANNKTKEALANSKNDFLKSIQYKSSVSRIETAISRIVDKNIRFELDYDPLSVKVSVDGQELEFDILPDGLKSIISWISNLLMRLDRIKWVDDTDLLDRNIFIFLDEIDLHLHPTWQRKILPVVQDLFRCAQIFVSTHSPFVVGSTDGMWIHKLGVYNNASVIDQRVVESEDSRSYQLILSEDFNIKVHFGVEIEKKLKTFRDLRNKLFHEHQLNREEMESLNELIHFFKNERSVELNSIIASELKQLEKVLGKNLFLQ